MRRISVHGDVRRGVAQLFHESEEGGAVELVESPPTNLDAFSLRELGVPGKFVGQAERRTGVPPGALVDLPSMKARRSFPVWWICGAVDVGSLVVRSAPPSR
jgi:hypothetical protein